MAAERDAAVAERDTLVAAMGGLGGGMVSSSAVGEFPRSIEGKPSSTRPRRTSTPRSKGRRAVSAGFGSGSRSPSVQEGVGNGWAAWRPRTPKTPTPHNCLSREGDRDSTARVEPVIMGNRHATAGERLPTPLAMMMAGLAGVEDLVSGKVAHASMVTEDHPKRRVHAGLESSATGINLNHSPRRDGLLLEIKEPDIITHDATEEPKSPNTSRLATTPDLPTHPSRTDATVTMGLLHDNGDVGSVVVEVGEMSQIEGSVLHGDTVYVRRNMRRCSAKSGANTEREFEAETPAQEKTPVATVPDRVLSHSGKVAQSSCSRPIDDIELAQCGGMGSELAKESVDPTPNITEAASPDRTRDTVVATDSGPPVSLGESSEPFLPLTRPSSAAVAAFETCPPRHGLGSTTQQADLTVVDRQRDRELVIHGQNILAQSVSTVPSNNPVATRLDNGKSSDAPKPSSPVTEDYVRCGSELRSSLSPIPDPSEPYSFIPGPRGDSSHVQSQLSLSASTIVPQHSDITSDDSPVSAQPSNRTTRPPHGVSSFSRAASIVTSRAVSVASRVVDKTKLGFLRRAGMSDLGLASSRATSMDTTSSQLGQVARRTAEGDDAEEEDNRGVEAVKRCMVGTYLYKYDRTRRKSHVRYFTLMPMSATISWSVKPATDMQTVETGKYAKILSYKEKLRRITDPSLPAPLTKAQRTRFHGRPAPLDIKTILITTPSRELELIAVDEETHEAWITSLNLIVGTQEPDRITLSLSRPRRAGTDSTFALPETVLVTSSRYPRSQVM
ncbi:hypothetical protein HDU93_000520 [Gonapodya sp. JEL0774]|nr:hypothetical protein HDU93_000520 [Gonapodya sp. JEL0774]